jgi:hypothetical protein
MMLIEGAIYRFNCTDELRYSRAARTKWRLGFIYPIQVNGTRVASTHTNLLYL